MPDSQAQKSTTGILELGKARPNEQRISVAEVPYDYHSNRLMTAACRQQPFMLG